MTAAASFGPAATFILCMERLVWGTGVDDHVGTNPASITGWLILNKRVRGVENTGSEDGMLKNENEEE